MPKTNLLKEEPELLPIKEATKKLGQGFSRRSILRRIDSGEWKEKIHWVDDRRIGAQRRAIKINITEVKKIRYIPAGKR